MVGEGRGASEKETPILLRLWELGVSRASSFCTFRVLELSCLGRGDGTLLWSGDFILMGLRALENREKLGDLVGEGSAPTEESKETFVRRGPVGLLTDDWGEPLSGDDVPPLEAALAGDLVGLLFSLEASASLGEAPPMAALTEDRGEDTSALEAGLDGDDANFLDINGLALDGVVTDTVTILL